MRSTSHKYFILSLSGNVKKVSAQDFPTHSHFYAQKCRNLSRWDYVYPQYFFAFYKFEKEVWRTDRRRDRQTNPFERRFLPQKLADISDTFFRTLVKSGLIPSQETFEAKSIKFTGMNQFSFSLIPRVHLSRQMMVLPNLRSFVSRGVLMHTFYKGYKNMEKQKCKDIFQTRVA